MPSKKKKYNARFPAGRIKKIMQTDEEVGKVAQAVPVIISRTLELFVESLLMKAMEITSAKNAKTLTPSHMKQCILSDQRFDFLKDLVRSVSDSNNGEDDSMPPGFLPPQTNKQVSERRKSNSTVVKDDDIEELTIKDEPILIKDEPIIIQDESVLPKSERVPESIAVPVIRSTKLNLVAPATANCSTLHLNPNFYRETSQEQKSSIHTPPLAPTYLPPPPLVPIYQPPDLTQLPRISQADTAASSHPAYQEPQAVSNPAPILVMDEDYDT